MKSKIEMQGDVFSGISSVFVVKNGITTSNGTGDIATANLQEFPVSDESGFNFDTGAPSVNRFKIKGLNSDWTCTFTPGDGQITLEIPCHETDILKTVFGQEGQAVALKMAKGEAFAGITPAENKRVELNGTGFGAARKAVVLGLLVLNDTADKILFIKKAKFMAQIMFDGSNKPLCVTLTGTLTAGADNDAFGVLVPSEKDATQG